MSVNIPQSIRDAALKVKHYFDAQNRGGYNYTTADGTVLNTLNPIAVGQAITVVTSQGSSPAPDGVYNISTPGGQTNSVTVVNGSVTEVEKANNNDMTNNAIDMVKLKALPVDKQHIILMKFAETGEVAGEVKAEPKTGDDNDPNQQFRSMVQEHDAILKDHGEQLKKHDAAIAGLSDAGHGDLTDIKSRLQKCEEQLGAEGMKNSIDGLKAKHAETDKHIAQLSAFAALFATANPNEAIKPSDNIYGKADPEKKKELFSALGAALKPGATAEKKKFPYN